MYSKTKISKKNALDNAKMQLDEYQKKLNKNLEIIEKEKVGKDVTNERKTLLDKIKDLEEEKLKLDNELKKYQDSNPAEYERMKKSIVVRRVPP
jgi:chromosome segregation ATPase